MYFFLWNEWFAYPFLHIEYAAECFFFERYSAQSNYLEEKYSLFYCWCFSESFLFLDPCYSLTGLPDMRWLVGLESV